MDLAERLDRRPGCAIDAGRIGDVADHAAHLRPELAQALDRARKRLAFDIGEHHLHAGLRESPAEREADAAGPAGYECRLAGEFAHDGPLTA
jgi:hypothetical protein